MVFSQTEFDQLLSFPEYKLESNNEKILTESSTHKNYTTKNVFGTLLIQTNIFNSSHTMRYSLN